jgi:ATP-dependent DNA helicase RecQ
MQARVITLRFSSMLEGFDDTPLRDFIKDKEVHALRDHFFTRNDVPYLAVMVSYSMAPLPFPAPAAAAGKPSGKKSDESWRHLIDEAEVPLFNSLRDWRSARCKRDGVPPYVICNNRQLATIVKIRPQSLAALGQVEGFGESKLRAYGPEILALMARRQPELPNEAPATDQTGYQTAGDQPEPAGGES